MQEPLFSVSPETVAWLPGFAARQLILPEVGGSPSLECSTTQPRETTVRERRNQRATPWARRPEPDACSGNPRPDGCRRRGTRLSSRNQGLSSAVSYFHHLIITPIM